MRPKMIEKMNILDNYKLEFEVRKIFNKDFKILHSINDVLSAYISEHNTPLLANSLLIEIDNILNEKKTEGGWDTQGFCMAKIKCNETKIYADLEFYEKNKKITPNYILPTKDFRAIVEAWKNFVEN